MATESFTWAQLALGILGFLVTVLTTVGTTLLAIFRLWKKPLEDRLLRTENTIHEVQVEQTTQGNAINEIRSATDLQGLDLEHVKAGVSDLRTAMGTLANLHTELGKQILQGIADVRDDNRTECGAIRERLSEMEGRMDERLKMVARR
jgi:2-keto-3-deoxy-L-rhamnonate aldolase RhmA